jgi:hypothetical protein
MKVWLRSFYLSMLYSPQWYMRETMTSYLKMATIQEKAIMRTLVFQNKVYYQNETSLQNWTWKRFTDR